MASCDPEDSPNRDETADQFSLKIASLHKQLDTRFKQYQLSLQERKKTLANQLNRIETEFKNSRKDYNKKRRALNDIHSNVKLQCATFKSLETTLLVDVEKQIGLLEEEFPDKDVKLVLDSTLSGEIEKFGRIELSILKKGMLPSPRHTPPPAVSRSPQEHHKSPPEPSYEPAAKECPKPRDFTTIKDPILCAVKQGDESADLKYPLRLAIDCETGFIFIADQTSHCVKIFSQEGVYRGRVLHNSSINRYGTGTKVELVHPFGVCFYEDYLYVTSHIEQNFNRDLQPCVFRFNRVEESGTDFSYSVSTGTRGSGVAQFDYPGNIISDPSNGDVYVCDKGDRVQILDKDLTFKRVYAKRFADVQFIGDRMYRLLQSSSVFTPNYDVVVSKRVGADIRTINSCGFARQVIISELNESHHIFCHGSTVKICKEHTPASIRHNPSYKALKSVNVTASTADDCVLEIRGMALDKSTQRLIMVLYSKDRMLQIF